MISDFLASLKAISHLTPSHPLVSRVQILLETCSSAPIAINSISAPSLISIPGNENVDRDTKQAIHQPTVNKSILSSNFDSFSYEYIN